MANKAFAYAPIILAMLCVSTVLADTKLGSRSPGYRRQWALVVGINYNELDDRVKSSVRPLENAESDALAFAEVLTTIYGYDPDNVRTLIGDQATSLRVRQALSKDFLANSKEVQEEDSVVFYFAGHGWRDKTLLSDASHVGFLCPSDVDITKEGEIDPATCVSIDLLVGQLRDFCPARHKLVILDCCHSGEIFNFARIRSAGANPRFRATLFSKPAIHAIAAARADQGAADAVEATTRHSPFTTCLLTALRSGPRHGDPELFSASELFYDIETRFRERRDELRGKFDRTDLSYQDPIHGTLQGQGEFYFFRKGTVLPDEDSKEWQTYLAHQSRSQTTFNQGRTFAWVLLGVAGTAIGLVVLWGRKQLMVNLAPAGAVSAELLQASEHLVGNAQQGPRSTESPIGTGDVSLRVPMVTAAIVLPISLVSLFLAYYSPWSTTAWGFRFDQLGDETLPRGAGFAIEAGRSILFIFLIVTICWFRFNEPFRRFINPRCHTWAVNVARAAFLTIAVYFGVHEAWRHLDRDRAAAQLALWASEHGITTSAAAEWWPYALYLPYSLINYLFVLPALAVIPLYGFSHCFSRLLQVQREIANPRATEETDKQVMVRFFNFEHYCASDCARYLDVLGVIALSIQFEYWVGRLTLTDEAFSLLTIGWALVGAAVLILVWITYLYVSGVEATKRVLLDRGSLDVATFSNQRNAVTFAKSVIMGNIGGLLLLSLVVPYTHKLVFG